MIPKFGTLRNVFKQTGFAILTFLICQNLNAQEPGQVEAKKPQTTEYREWSRGAWTTLREAKRNANFMCRSARSEAEFKDCADELIVGMERALEGLPSWSVGPLTATAIARGPSYARAIRGTDSRIEENSNIEMTLSYFLFQYYSHIEYVHKHLDERFYDSPDRRDDFYDFPRENPLFQIEIARNARNQLNLVLDNLTEKSNRVPHNGFVVSLGNDRAFLNALLLSARYASRDLQTYFRRNLFSDEIDRLEFLAEGIEDFLSANPPRKRAMPSEVMVTRSYHEALSISRSLSDRCDRGFDRLPPEERLPIRPTLTEEIWSSRFTLYDADLKSLEIRTRSLHQGQRVRAVGAYVKLEAYRHPARVQVHINGELMGDISLPAMDPNLYINLRGSQPTNSIEFRHINGGRVEVSQVDLVYEVPAPPASRRER